MFAAERLLNDDDASLLCPRCGVRGQHATAATCIHALRDILAVFDIKGTYIPKPEGKPRRSFPRLHVARVRDCAE